MNPAKTRTARTSVAGVTSVNDGPALEGAAALGEGSGSRGLTRRTCISTLEQSPERRRYGSDRPQAGDRAGYQQDAEVHRAYRVRRVRQAQRASGVSPADAAQNATRRVCRGQGQADLPAQQPSSGPGAWVSAADAYARWSRHRHGPASQGPALADCLSTGSTAVLPAQFRMKRSADFGATVKQGRRAVQPDVIVYSRVICDGRTDTPAVSTATPPQVGLIIAKSVGSAVERHRVARRLRHVAREVLGDLRAGQQVVIRALPGSNRATSQTLRAQLRAGLRAVQRPGGAAR